MGHFYKNKYSVSVIQLVLSSKLRRPKYDWNFVQEKLFLEISTYIPWICILLFPLDIYAISSRVPFNFFLSAILHCLICPCSHHGADVAPFISCHHIQNHLLQQASFSYIIQTILPLSTYRVPIIYQHLSHNYNCVISWPSLHLYCKSLEKDYVLFIFVS